VSEVSYNELEDLAEATAKALTETASALMNASDALMKAAVRLQSFRRLWCRHCKKTFAWDAVKKTNALTIPCPDCGDVLIPARNVRPEDKT
jgi:RNase P subunit RPR2